MSFVDTSDELWTTISSIVEDQGLRLYDLERVGPQSLRVFVEGQQTPETNGAENSGSQSGVTSGDCTKLLKRLMVFFKVEGPRFALGIEPQMEVSSPGVNRLLRLPRHFEAAIGERVRVLPERVNGASGKDGKSKKSGPVIGVLKASTTDSLVLDDELDGCEVTFPLETVKKARIEFKFD